MRNNNIKQKSELNFQHKFIFPSFFVSVSFFPILFRLVVGIVNCIFFSVFWSSNFGTREYICIKSKIQPNQIETNPNPNRTKRYQSNNPAYTIEIHQAIISKTTSFQSSVFFFGFSFLQFSSVRRENKQVSKKRKYEIIQK